MARCASSTGEDEMYDDRTAQVGSPRWAPPPPPPPPARSSLAAALLNLTGLGLGYSYLGRWWRQALHLAITAALVAIAFVTGAAALPGLWIAVAVAWLGWMAFDARRVASTAFRPGPQVVPVAVAVLAVGAVVAGYVFYGLAGDAAYAGGAAARDRGDCAAALPQYDLVTGVYELTLSGDVARADAEGAQCRAYVAATDAEAGGDFARAVTLYQDFRRANPDTVLAPFVDEDLFRAYGRWGAMLRAGGEYDQAATVYRDQLAELGDDPRAAGVRAELAATLVEEADDLRSRIPTLTDPLAALTDATNNLLSVQRDFPDTPSAAGAAQGIVDTYAAAVARVGPACNGLPVLDYAVGLPDAETGGVVARANADRARAQFACGIERYDAGEWADAGAAFDTLVASYPDDPQAAQAIANAIAAEASDRTGAAVPLPGPFAGDNPGPIPLTIYNDNPAEVRVLVVGPTAHEIVIPGCPGCPAEYATAAEACPSLAGKPSSRLTLPAGDYTVVGIYPTASPSVQRDPVENGFEYTNCLFIRLGQ
jgi:tetratricopeptide (TPR) repeat protein